MQKVKTYSAITFKVALIIMSCDKPKDHAEVPVNPHGKGTTSTRGTNPVAKKFALFHLVRYKNTPSDLMPYLHPAKIGNESHLLNADYLPDVRRRRI